MDNKPKLKRVLVRRATVTLCLLDFAHSPTPDLVKRLLLAWIYVTHYYSLCECSLLSSIVRSTCTCYLGVSCKAPMNFHFFHSIILFHLFLHVCRQAKTLACTRIKEKVSVVRSSSGSLRQRPSPQVYPLRDFFPLWSFIYQRYAQPWISSLRLRSSSLANQSLNRCPRPQLPSMPRVLVSAGAALSRRWLSYPSLF